VVLILFWTKGALLYGSDSVGFYNAYDFISLPSIDNLVKLVSLGIGLGNIYAGFYIYLFIVTVMDGVGLYLLTKYTFSLISTNRPGTIAYFLPLVLFLFSPFAISAGYLSLVDYQSVFVASFLVFLGLGMKYFISTLGKGSFTKVDYVALAISLGLSLTIFPNFARILLIAALLLLFYTLVAFLIVPTTPLRNIVKNVGYVICVLTSALVVSLYLNYGYFVSLGSTISQAAVGATNQSYIGFYTGSFNTTLNSSRLLTSWAFTSTPYSSLYSTPNLVSATSLLWPVLALIAPLIIAWRRNFKVVASLEIFLLLCLFWEKGDNQPFGSIWVTANSALPYGYSTLPTGDLTQYVLWPMYAVIITAVIYTIAFSSWPAQPTLPPNEPPKPHGPFRPNMRVIVAIGIVLLLLISVVPIFDGTVETKQWYANQPAGFRIPGSYFDVRNYLIGAAAGKSVLLLPGSSSNPYVQVSWGYEGSIYLYNQFFDPVSLVTLLSMIGTSAYANQTAQQQYLNLTHPFAGLGGITNFSEPTQEWRQLISAFSVGYILLDTNELCGSACQMYDSDSVRSLLVNGTVREIEDFSGGLTLYAIAPNVSQEREAAECSRTTCNEHSRLTGNDPLGSIVPTVIGATRLVHDNYTDTGNPVMFALGNSSITNVSWHIQSNLVSSAPSFIWSFNNSGYYDVTADTPYGDASMVENVSSPLTCTLNVTGNSSASTYSAYSTSRGGTIFPHFAYGFRWYFDSVYLSNVGDRNFGIDVGPLRQGVYNLSVTVSDALGLNVSKNVVLHAPGPLDGVLSTVVGGTNLIHENYSDVGSPVIFALGNSSISNVTWYIQSKLVSSAPSFDWTFNTSGYYNVTACTPYGNATRLENVSAPLTGVIFVSGDPTSNTFSVYATSSGGTIFPHLAYGFRWYLDSVYLSSVGDSNFGISIGPLSPGTHNLTLTVNDALGLRAYRTVTITVMNPYVAWLYGQVVSGALIIEIPVVIIVARVVVQRLPQIRGKQ
jgi:hypothetical protein